MNNTVLRWSTMRTQGLVGEAALNYDNSCHGTFKSFFRGIAYLLPRRPITRRTWLVFSPRGGAAILISEALCGRTFFPLITNAKAISPGYINVARSACRCISHNFKNEMRVSLLAARVFAVFTVARGASVQSEASGTSALQALVERRLPQSLHSAFEFNIYSSSSGSADSYTVSQAAARRISINATSTSALSRGLLVYLRSLGTDIFWTSDTFSSLPPSLPHLTAPLSATTWAQIRYMFNVVTYSYTTAFWTWTRWEYLLDWCSLHGINMPLAIGGQEYVWREVYRDFGVADADIYDWFAGPAFHSWHRMGNLHSSWGADNAKHPTTPSWIDAQWALQLRIVTRMVALGMTPVLPGSAGFIPPALHTILGGDLLTASMWENLPVEYTEDVRASFFRFRSKLTCVVRRPWIPPGTRSTLCKSRLSRSSTSYTETGRRTITRWTCSMSSRRIRSTLTTSFQTPRLLSRGFVPPTLRLSGSCKDGACS